MKNSLFGIFRCSIECQFHKWQLLYRVIRVESIHLCLIPGGDLALGLSVTIAKSS